MKTNMGNTDKIIRILLAVVFVTLFTTKVITGALALVLIVLGGIFLATSLISFCPLYRVFGWNTCAVKK
jgi:hypothetical protein